MRLAGKIRLVVSDVDGTIVRTDKSLAPETVQAAQRLQSAGVPLAIVSARPPRGMRHIAERLRLSGPYAGFNGGMLVGPDGATLEWHPVPEAAVRAAIDLFTRHRIGIFLFTRQEWLIRDPEGAHVAHERHTVLFDPRVVDSFDPYVAEVGKLVGVCDDAPRLAELEGELQSLVGRRANAVRSQTYYLDLTHPYANKGHAVEALARHAGCSTAETVVLGDQQNDIPMFRVAGYSICMGNGPPDAQKAADDVTGGNDSGGWAEAVDRLILPRLRTAAPEGGR